MNDHVSPISVVSAGAGTGKTWRLSSEYLRASHAGTSPARIVATTFTVKAAAELIERVRTRLIQEGFPDDAQRALAGLVGTVNSVCGRLVTDFAIDGGLSPIADMIPPEMADALFAMATEEVIQKFSPDLDPIAQRLGQDDWRKIVSKIVGAARASGIQAASFADCANRSWRGLAPLLAQKATETPEQIDAALVGAIRSCVGQIEAGADSTVKTAKVLEDLRRTLSRFSNGRPLPWDDWARLSKLNSAKASQSFVESVVAQASRHPTHPRLHDDLERFITQVFACAAEALERFSEFKRDRGLIDFADQEALALELLRRPEVRERLGEWFDLLMVDEFQDTSPIQLAVFLEVAKAVKKSLWVGDQKQAIFGFRQTDPALVNAVIEVIRPATSGTDESLDTSRRSRPELVRFANALFGAAFPPKGVPKERVMIPNVHRREPSGFGPALNHWTIAGKNWSDALEALADRIRSMLAAPQAIKVVDRADGAERALRPSDIAILCRQNQRCKAVADALGQLGIPSAMHRDGLLETPEARLAMAALRYLVDPEDSLAIAELAHFNEGNDDWLTVWLTEGRDVLMARCPAIASLEENRLCLAHLTPVEALQSAIAAAKIDQLVRRWGRPGERLANLDALVKAGRQYEDSCRASRGAATAGGLVAYFAKGIKDGGERPAFEGDDSVRVLTYHKAKGLEWPMVILLDLQEETKGSPFGVYSESPPDGLDPWNPLVGRWVRLWPWPYGKQEKNVHLDRTAAASPEATARTEAELAELVRLLYVGVTRARDYLIFSSRSSTESAWLEVLADAGATPILTLPTTEGQGTVRVEGEQFAFAVERLAPPAESAEPQASTTPVWWAPFPIEGDKPRFPPAWVSPSNAPADEISRGFRLQRPIDIGGRLPLTGSPDMQLLGEAVHGFLAADRTTRSAEQRFALAKDALDRWGVTGALQGASMLEASDRLHYFVTGRWPQARWRREVPIFGSVNNQRVSGQIDLLIETDEGCVILDHKTFPECPRHLGGEGAIVFSAESRFTDA